MLIPI
jgi:hypothetical protein